MWGGQGPSKTVEPREKIASNSSNQRRTKYASLLRFLCKYSVHLIQHATFVKYRVIQKEVYTFKNLFYKYYWTYGDVLYIDWRENSQSYFHTLQALDVSPTFDAADVKSIIQLFPHSSQHVTDNSSHSLSDAPHQIIEIRTLRDFLSIRTQDMDLASAVFCKINF
jgi:hypothetical protein